MLKDILIASLLWSAQLPIKLAAQILGYFVIPIALLNEHVNHKTKRSGTWSGWKKVDLPRWAWIWGNDRDGAMGDPDGRYWLRDAPKFLNFHPFWKEWWWLAVRNPVNNLGRFTKLYSVNLDKVAVEPLAGTLDTVRDKLGHEGWQFVKAVRPFPAYGFYGVWRYGKSKYGLVIRLGNKIEPRHNAVIWTDKQKAIKGWTFRIAPFKDL